MNFKLSINIKIVGINGIFTPFTYSAHYWDHTCFSWINICRGGRKLLKPKADRPGFKLKNKLYTIVPSMNFLLFCSEINSVS